MSWQIVVYVIPLLASAAVAVTVSAYAWRRKSTTAALPVSWGMLAVACWSIAYAFELASSDLTVKVFWTRVEYVGIILAALCTPLVLDSWLALIPGLLIVILFVIRTGLEDRTLQAELPGYPEYAAKVRYRLLPGIW